MEVTFITDSAAQPTSPRPKRQAKACDVCKKRKKRCLHVNGSQSAPCSAPKAATQDGHVSPKDVAATGQSERNPYTAASTHRARAHVGGRNSHSPTSVPVSSQSIATPEFNARFPSTAIPDTPRSLPRHFVGDLNPEAEFLCRAEEESNHEDVPSRDHVGVWLDKREWDALVQHKNDAETTRIGLLNVARQRGNHNPINSRASLGTSDQEALIDIYFTSVAPFFPVVSRDILEQYSSDGTTSGLLIQAICLVASKDSRAEPYLRLKSDPTVIMKPRDFATRVYTSIVEDLRSDHRIDKVTLIRALALASLHNEGLNGAEQSSMHLCNAIHYAQTIGIHVRDTDEAMKTLFWSLWSLDKFNAAMNGRPTMINDDDIGVSKPSSADPTQACFVIMVNLASMLNKVISFYRPCVSPIVTGWEEDFPGFDEIVGQSNGFQLSSSLLATLELVYFAIAILSFRSRPVNYISSSAPSFTRHCLSALQMTSLISGESYKSLHPIPMVPYGVSLALSVAYRRLRHSRFPHQQARAKLDFQVCSKTLQDLRRKWWSADIMASLSTRILNEVKKSSNSGDLRPSPSRNQPTRDRLEHNRVTNSANSSSTSRALLRGDSRDSERGRYVEPISTYDNITRSESQHQPLYGEDPGRLHNQANYLDALDWGDLGTMATSEAIDNIFGANLDPNFPMNFEDLMFLGSTTSFGLS